MSKRKILSALLLVFTIGAVKAQDANILVGLNGPSYGVKIKNNFPGETRGFARAFMLSNQDASIDFFGFGVNGNVVNGISTPAYGYIGQNYSTPMMSFLPNGNVGIGTITPNYNLDISGKLFVRGSGAYYNNPGEAELQIGYGIAPAGTVGTVSRLSIQPYGHTGGPWKFNARDDASSAYLDINYGILNALTIHHEGNVGIGIKAPKEKLSVNGNIRAKELKIEAANWPDYVFKKDYELPTLEQTEKHIQEKGHLPGIPSAEEVKAEGIEVGEMNAKLLKKIEELTLYLIEQNKKMSALEKDNIELKKAVFKSQKNPK